MSQVIRLNMHLKKPCLGKIRSLGSVVQLFPLLQELNVGYNLLETGALSLSPFLPSFIFHYSPVLLSLSFCPFLFRPPSPCEYRRSTFTLFPAPPSAGPEHPTSTPFPERSREPDHRRYRAT